MEVLRRGRCGGALLERVLGHYTWQALVAWPDLCVFDECYQLVHRSRHTTEPMSLARRNDIQLAVSFLPLLV